MLNIGIFRLSPYDQRNGRRGAVPSPFTSSYKEMMIYAQFCPFTGKPLYQATDEAEKEEVK